MSNTLLQLWHTRVPRIRTTTEPGTIYLNWVSFCKGILILVGVICLITLAGFFVFWLCHVAFDILHSDSPEAIFVNTCSQGFKSANVAHHPWVCQ